VNAEPGKLLVVDDDANNRDMLSRRLARRGYAVEVAESGPDALQKINAAQYDLILLDQMMPGMSGLDMLRLLRATYSQTELPVIMVTAVDQSQSVVDALDQGANDYVVKPVDLPVVAARIQAQLSRSLAERNHKSTDALTGLQNRMRFLHNLGLLLEAQKADGTTLGVLLADLDGFKVINDSFGHATGDQILKETAARLNTFREHHAEAEVFRLGSDEFAVILRNVPNQEALRLRAAELAERLSAPVLCGGALLTNSVSIGMVSHAGGEVSSQDLLADADLALYRAKELGKNRIEMFDADLRERAHTRVALAMDLRHALERDQLIAYYQPKINLADKSVAGFEALLRWRHPERGFISPVEFIPLAEETGLIIPIGRWILREACRQLKIWNDKFQNKPPLSMNVNLSVKQLADPNLVDEVKKVLEETSIEPELLKLELTESSLMTEIESARSVLSELRAMRVGLKLDDFGTGYSSLSYLRTLQFESLKIDRSFISKISTDRETHAIVGTIVDLAHTLNMDVVAEGIETEDQLAQLIELGCDLGQGFLFAKPLAAAEAENVLRPATAA
jgi:diguanylate cyclase (GGDEF)-like protein